MAATRLPLIVLDEIMLPAAATDLALEPGEVRYLQDRHHAKEGEPFAVAIAMREPGARAPLAIESRAAGPGALLGTALVGEATLVPASAEDPLPKVSITSTTRARLLGTDAEGEGWIGSVEGWSYASEGFESGAVGEIVSRFYKVLLATRGEHVDGIREQIEDPVHEIESAEGALHKLLLVADYVYERPDMRQALLEAEAAQQLVELVIDALDILEQGVPTGPGHLRQPISLYLQEGAGRGIADLAKTAQVLRVLGPLMKPEPRVAEELEAVADELAGLERRFDKLIVKLLKPRRR